MAEKSRKEKETFGYMNVDEERNIKLENKKSETLPSGSQIWSSKLTYFHLFCHITQKEE